MNVFVLCTGRCGSSTFIEACHQIQNFTAGHESRARLIGEERLNYPDQHIEADNRLSWLLGRLDATYGDRAVYVHLQRNLQATAASFLKRWDRGILGAYSNKIILKGPRPDRMAVCLDYCETVNRNIEMFLKDKSRVHQARLESLSEDFTRIWQDIGAEGDLSAALAALQIKHNAS